MSECESLVERIRAVEGCPDTKRRVLELLVRELAVRGPVFGARTMMREQVRRRALAVAIDLLRQHTTTRAALALQERFGVSPRTAQRYVAQARRVLRDGPA